MSERRTDASRKLYSRGGYNGGSSLSVGYKTLQRNGRLELEPDAGQVAEIRVIADKVLAGQSVNGVAVEHGIHAPTLHKRLRRVELKGWVTYNDEIVRDGEGLPVMRPPISTPGHGTGCKRANIFVRVQADALPRAASLVLIREAAEQWKSR